MRTPPASAAAEGQGGAAGEAQPMSVSPAPIQGVQQPDSATGTAGATAGEAGGAQPPAAAQQAQQSAASGLPYGMPVDLYNSVMVSNLRQLGTMQLLSASIF